MSRRLPVTLLAPPFEHDRHRVTGTSRANHTLDVGGARRRRAADRHNHVVVVRAPRRRQATPSARNPCNADHAPGVLETELTGVALAGKPRAQDEAGARQQPCVIGDLVALDVPREELVREGAIAGDVGQRVPGVGHRVRAVDVAGQPPARLAVLLPERPHEVIERDPSVAPVPQREVEREADCFSPRVVRDERAVEIGPIDRGRGVEERREPAHLLGGADQPPRLHRHRVDDPGGVSDVVGQAHETGANEDERPVVAGEPFREPQLARHVGILEVERLERPRPDALHVPDVEELV